MRKVNVYFENHWDSEIDCHRASWKHTHTKPDQYDNYEQQPPPSTSVMHWKQTSTLPQTCLRSSLTTLVHPWSLGGLRKPANVDWRISGASFSSQEDPHFHPCPRGFPRLASGPWPVLKIAILQTLSQWDKSTQPLLHMDYLKPYSSSYWGLQRKTDWTW